MTVDDCINEYTRLGAEVFGRPRLFKFSLTGPVSRGSLEKNTRKLEELLEEMVDARNAKTSIAGPRHSRFESTPVLCKTLVYFPILDIETDVDLD